MLKSRDAKLPYRFSSLAYVPTLVGKLQKERSRRRITMERACGKQEAPHSVFYPFFSPTLNSLQLLFSPFSLPTASPANSRDAGFRSFINHQLIKKKKKKTTFNKVHRHIILFLFFYPYRSCARFIHIHQTECYPGISMANELIRYWNLCQIARMDLPAPRISLYQAAQKAC